MVAKLVKLYKSVLHGVAFIPLVITIFIASIAVVLLMIENRVEPLLEFPRFLRINKVDTTRVLLSSILTGMISLTVFSFSMMMVVVNQAASLYSPKIIDTLMNDNYNKYTLGIYLGTILYTIVTIMRLDSYKDEFNLPHFAIFINILLPVFSIIVFVNFINNISNSVRINAIIKRIFSKTKHALHEEDKMHCTQSDIDTTGWFLYAAGQSGYFQLIRVSQLLALLQQEDLTLKVLVRPGSYLTERSPLFLLNKQPKDSVIAEIRDNFLTYSGEVIGDNEFYGFRQLREIAVKALSPGVNDPGIAKICIDYLGELLSFWLSREKNNVVLDDTRVARIILNRHDFKSLLGECLMPIKVYGKRDYVILNALLSVLKDLSLYDEDRARRDILSAYALSFIRDGEKSIHDFLERSFLNETIQRMNKGGYFELPLIKENIVKHTALNS